MFERDPSALENIDRVRRIAPPDRQSAEQHDVVSEAKLVADRAALHAHGFLRASIQPFATRQQHGRLQPHPDIGPLRLLHQLGKMAEQQDRCAEREHVDSANASRCSV